MVGRMLKDLAMSESLTDRTEPRSRRGAGEAGFGTESLMQDKASCLSKWLSAPKRAYPATGYGRINDQSFIRT